MKILALEMSSAQRSVAVVQGPAQGEPVCLSEVVETGGRAAKPFGMIEAALREAKLEREQIECLAVGLGPGSYTGIRASIALAQGWQLAREVGLMGVSSAECLAAQAQAEGIRGPILVVCDAQRGEFYLAAYELRGAGRRETERLRLATLLEVQQRAQAAGAIVGPEVSHWFPSGHVVFPRAATLGGLALRHPELVPGEKLEPIYLRETKFVKAPPSRVLPI